MNKEKTKKGSRNKKTKNDSAIVVAIIGLIGTLIAAIFASPVLIALVQKPSTSTPTPITTSSPSPTFLNTETSVSSDILFSLKNAKPEDFYTLKDGSFVFLDNGNLAIAGGFGGGTYINMPMPKNFRATIQFVIENPEDEFIIGLSDGKEMRPNYHLVMNQKAAAFKQQLGFDITEGWDNYIKNVSFPIKSDYLYEVVFERKNAGVTILINNVFVIGLGSLEVGNINSYDYLYFTGAIRQQVIIMSLVIDETQ